MLNDIKSELYRTFCNKSYYLMTGALAGLILLMNGILWLCRVNFGEKFGYGVTSYSFSILVNSPMFYCLAAAMIAQILYESDKKQGNAKNAVAFGISRTKIFLGKCIAGLIACLASLVLILTVYITSAVLLLEQAGPVGIFDLLTEVPAMALSAGAALILMIALQDFFEKNAVAFVIWIGVFFGIPQLLFYLGFGWEILMKIAMWMPRNLFVGMQVNMTECVTVWESAEGMGRCLLVGGVWMFLCTLAGWLLLRRKEIA